MSPKTALAKPRRARTARAASPASPGAGPVRVAVIGCGDWGKNLVREFYQSPQAELVSCCDTRPERLADVARQFPKARGISSAEEVFGDPTIEAVIIATPAITHAALTQAALRAGKHVFVEKPIALSVADAQACLAAATTANRCLMVGHLLRYHPAFLALKRLVETGELGTIRYVYTQRLNLGRIRSDENAMWSLAPHDISMILDLFGEMPTMVAAHGACFIQPTVEDIVFVTLRFSDGRLGHVHLSWLDPHKIRKITVVGSQKMVTFDDMEPAEKLRIYDKGAARGYDSYGDWWVTLRTGDIQIPRVDMTEPLRLESQHFLECIRQGRRPISDGEDGLRVLRVLDAAQQSLAQAGGWVRA